MITPGAGTRTTQQRAQLRAEIMTLRRTGHTVTDTAQRLGVSRATVYRAQLDDEVQQAAQAAPVLGQPGGGGFRRKPPMAELRRLHNRELRRQDAVTCPLCGGEAVRLALGAEVRAIHAVDGQVHNELIEED